ncbi:MAG: hypothetical protein H5T33_08300, partial [Candidatus Methanosuratus sp.]|nr:hypothetical protein [Candidatus Methanosuratincola sp.]
MGPLKQLIGEIANRFSQLATLLTQVLKVVRLPDFEEALPGIWNLSLHFRFVLRMPRPCRVSDEAPVLGILQKASGQLGIKRVLSTA